MCREPSGDDQVMIPRASRDLLLRAVRIGMESHDQRVAVQGSIRRTGARASVACFYLTACLVAGSSLAAWWHEPLAPLRDAFRALLPLAGLWCCVALDSALLSWDSTDRPS